MYCKWLIVPLLFWLALQVHFTQILCARNELVEILDQRDEQCKMETPNFLFSVSELIIKYDSKLANRLALDGSKYLINTREMHDFSLQMQFLICGAENLLFWLGLVWLGLNVIEYGIEYLMRWIFYFTFFTVVFQGYRTFQKDIKPIIKTVKKFTPDVVDNLLDKFEEIQPKEFLSDIQDTITDAARDVLDVVQGTTTDELKDQINNIGDKIYDHATDKLGDKVGDAAKGLKGKWENRGK